MAGRKRGKGWERDAAIALPMPVSSRFIFVFALSQFSGPDYLETWNRLCSLPSLLLLLKLPNILSLLDYIYNDWLNKKKLQLPHSFVWQGQLLLLPSPLLSATSLSARVICTFAMFYSPYEIKIIAAFQINLSHQYWGLEWLKNYRNGILLFKKLPSWYIVNFLWFTSDSKEGKVTENGWPDDDTTFSPGKHWMLFINS